MAKKRLKIKDKQGNVVDYDISAASVTIDVEGKSLDVKLRELVDAISRSVKSVTFNGNSPTMDSNGNVNLGQQVQPDWKEGNINWPSFIRNKPSFSRVATTGSYNDLTDKPTIPEGVQADSQMSDSSDAPVKNRVIKAYVDNLISGLINGAPQALDTLNELSAALGNDANFAATITQQLAGKISGIKKHDGTPIAPDENGIVTLPEQTEVDLSDYYDKDEVDGLVDNAGKVKSVSVNDGEPIEPDADGIVDLGDLQGPAGPQGPQGLQGNSGVASADEVIVVNNLTEGGTDAEVDGVTKVKVLSAEMGKKLATEGLVESGTFSQAYAKAGLNPTAFFPWFLVDEDNVGNTIKKMIWHSGSQIFIDAIGSVVEGETGELVYLKKYNWDDFDYADVVSVDAANRIIQADSSLSWFVVNQFDPYTMGLILKENSMPGVSGARSLIGGALDENDSTKFIARDDSVILSSAEAIANTRLVNPLSLVIPLEPTDDLREYRLDIIGYTRDGSQSYSLKTNNFQTLWTNGRNDINIGYYWTNKSVWFSIQLTDATHVELKVLHEKGTTYRVGQPPLSFQYDYDDVKTTSVEMVSSYANKGIWLKRIIGPIVAKLYRV